MDGLTVKRRSTIGLGVLGRRRSGENQPQAGIADYVTAMTVGIPQLETFNYVSTFVGPCRRRCVLIRLYACVCLGCERAKGVYFQWEESN